MASTRSSVMDEALADVALHGELVALKEAGNAAFRAGSDREAFGHYTAGITRALQANAVCLEAGDGQDSMFQVCGVGMGVVQGERGCTPHVAA